MGQEYIRPNLLAANNVFSRHVILIDDFSGNVNWVKDGTGADYNLTYDDSVFYHPSKSMKLVTRATNPAEDDYITANRYLILPHAGLFTSRFKIMSDDISLIKYFLTYISVYTSTQQYFAALRYDPNTPTCEYLDSANSFQTISDLAVGTLDNRWLQLEIILNLICERYHSFRIADVTADLSTVALRNPDANNKPYLYFTFQIYTAGAAQATIYIDDVYIGEVLTT